MTQHSQNGEVIAWSYRLATGRTVGGAYSGWEDRLSRHKPNVPANSISNLTPLYARQSLAREPATADVGRAKCSICGGRTFVPVQVKSDAGGFVDSSVRRCIECKTTFNAQAFVALSRAAPSSVDHKPGCEHSRAPIKLCDCPAAPSSEPAIAEGERKPIDVTAMVSEALGDHQVGNRPALKKRLIADIRAALATTPPTTNDAIPAGRRILIAKALARHPDSSWDDYEWEDMASFVQDRFLEQADLALAALSAAPSAPATEAGEEAQAWGDRECSGCTLPRRDCECN